MNGFVISDLFFRIFDMRANVCPTCRKVKCEEDYEFCVDCVFKMVESLREDVFNGEIPYLRS